MLQIYICVMITFNIVGATTCYINKLDYFATAIFSAVAAVLFYLLIIISEFNSDVNAEELPFSDPPIEPTEQDLIAFE